MNLGEENEFQEFKESLSQLDKGLKSLSAMLNRNGKGTIYFGVDDNGNVIGGIQKGKKTFEDIRNKVKNLIDPSVTISIKSLKDENNNVYIKLYAEGTDIPYSFDGRYFIRNVSSDEKVENNLLRKMLISSDQDIISNIESDIQSLHFTQFLNYLVSFGLTVKNNRNFFKSKNFFTKDNKYNLLAYLLSDENDLSIKVVSFEGIDKTGFSKRTEFGKKCLLLSVKDVLNYISSINTTKIDVSNGIREEINLFNFEAFREAWINACVHSSWQNLLGPSIFIFDNRIEILSYGSLPYGLSLDEFFDGCSKPVNRSLLNIFNSAGFSEQSGRGIPKIINAYSKDVFKFSGDTIKVTFKFNYVPDFVAFRTTKQSFFDKLTKNQKDVYEYLKNNQKATLNQVSLDTSISISTVKKAASKLQELKLIERKGSKKEGYWEIL